MHHHGTIDDIYRINLLLPYKINPMKKLTFIFFVFVLAACSRRASLNYQSSHDSGYQQDNTPAPVAPPPAQPSGGGGSGSYQSQPANAQNYDAAPAQTNNYTTNNYYNDPGYQPQPAQVNYSDPSYQTFYDELSPYGSWVTYNSYGYVWVPTSAGYGFTPYGTNGNWVYTEYGWTWNSYYHWGWAPFHYGRWLYDDYYGWMWVPGHQWAPAWVTWGHCNGYYGWAPIGPGVNNYVGYNPPIRYWSFVPENNITQVNVYNYTVSSTKVVTNVNNITIINNSGTYGSHTYNSGPKPAEVEKITNTHITAVKVTDVTKPSAGTASTDHLNIFRPAINTTNTAKQVPNKVTPLDKVTPISERNKQVNQQPNTNNKPQQVDPAHQNQKPGAPQEKYTPAQPNQRPTEPTRNQPPVQQQQPVEPNRPNQPPVQRQEPRRVEPNRQTQPPVEHPSEPHRQQPNQPPVQRQPEPQRQQVEPTRQQPPVQRQEPTRVEPQRQAEPQRQQQPVQRVEQPRQQERTREQPRQQPSRQQAPRQSQPQQRPQEHERPRNH